jgi:hypothetical protein
MPDLAFKAGDAGEGLLARGGGWRGRSGGGAAGDGPRSLALASARRAPKGADQVFDVGQAAESARFTASGSRAITFNSNLLPVSGVRRRCSHSSIEALGKP